MKKLFSLFLVLFLLLATNVYPVTQRLISRFQRARPKLLKAQAYYNKGKYKKAEKTINECLKRMPEYSEAHYLLANIMLKKNRLNEALLNSKAAIDDYKYRYILYRYFSDEENKKAPMPSTETIKLREEKKQRIKNIEAKYYFQYGNIFFKLKKFRKAYEQYLKAIEINPKHGEAYNNIANLYYMSKQYKKALESLYKAKDNGVKINPKFEEALKKALNK